MQLDMPIGHRGGLTSGGSGKAILAYMTPEERERALAAEPLAALTSQTITDRSALDAELARIRGRGYSIDNQEVVMGVYCVSVPLLDHLARPMGAISISGPSVKAPGTEVLLLVEMLNEACEYVSRRLGYAGPWPPAEAAVQSDAA